MTACVKCGHDPSAPVLARWEFYIEREVQSLNAYQSNHGSSRWAYKLDRDAWQQWFIVLGRKHRVTPAAGMRRVTLTRCYAGRQRELDADNLAGGAKVIVDAMVRAGLLRGDDRASVQVTYLQRKVSGAAGLEVVIEEIGEAK